MSDEENTIESAEEALEEGAVEAAEELTEPVESFGDSLDGADPLFVSDREIRGELIEMKSDVKVKLALVHELKVGAHRRTVLPPQSPRRANTNLPGHWAAPG